MRIVTRHNNGNRYLYIFMYIHVSTCDMCLYTVNMSDFVKYYDNLSSSLYLKTKLLFITSIICNELFLNISIRDIIVSFE